MKSPIFRLFSFFPFVLIFCMLLGCGPEKAQEESTEIAVPVAESAEAESGPLVAIQALTKPAELEMEVEILAAELRKENPELEKADAPIQMTYYFIRALQTNNKKAVLGMLTQDAYRELANCEDVPCPEFIQNSEVEFGTVQYLSDEQDEKKIVGARVGTTWNVQTEEGAVKENIAWVFRFENDAWLVAGMISILDPKYPPILINFEDLKETEQQFAELEKEIEKIDAEMATAGTEATETAVSDEEPTSEPIAKSAVEPATDPTVEPATDPIVEPAVEKEAETGVENEKTQKTVPSRNVEEPASELPAELPASL